MSMTNGAVKLSTDAINGADTAWVMISACLVMLMTPALGFFYGGLVRQKNILTMIIQCFAILAAIGIVWAILGFTLAFGDSCGHMIGNLKHIFLAGVGLEPYHDAPTIPLLAFFFFQLFACAITPALIVGGPAERFALMPSVIFSCVWVLLVYCPLCHWVFHSDGWLNMIGAKDFAGGMVVHMSAGFSTVAMSLLVGPRKQTSGATGPHNISYAVLGAALLWFGWFGYNGGAAFAANSRAALAVTSTNLSASTAAFSWAAVDYFYTKKISAAGMATGSVAGLIAMTCGCGFCPVWSSLIIGTLGGIFSNLFVRLREEHHLVDDTLDVFGCHGVCGTWGVFATGLFASAGVYRESVDGLFFGRPIQLGYQMAGIVMVAVYSFGVTVLIGIGMKALGILRASDEDEEKGLDLATYNENAYIVIPQAPKLETS